jgi:DHA3 family macrolide efflux protein-like MFS transporter
LGVLLVVFVQDVIGAGAQQFGWVLTARGLGGVMGGLAVARIGHHIRPRNLMACGMAGTGILLLIMVQFPVLPVMIVAGVAVGLPAMAWLVAGQTWLQAHTEDSYRGRVFGAFETYSALMGLLGIGLATFSGEALGAVLGMYISAFLFIAGGLFCYFLLRPRIPEAGAVKGKALT